MPLRKVPGPLVDETHHKRRDTALAKLRGRFAHRRSSDEACLQKAPRGPAFRAFVVLFYVAAGIAFIGAICAGLLASRLSQGPISLEAFKPRIQSALDERLGDGYRFRFSDAVIENGGRGPGVSVSDLVVSDPGGRTIIAAPRAEVLIHLPALLIGQFAPSRLELFDLDIRLSVQPDGSVSVSAGNDPVVLRGPARPSGESVDLAVPIREKAPVTQVMGEALRSVMDIATSRNSILGELKHVGVARGSLAFEDQATGRAVNFDGLEFAFDKSRSMAHLGLSARGPNGRWRFDAQTSGAGADQALDVEVTNLTFDEMSLVGGLREPDFDFDMPLSFKARLSMASDGRLGVSSGSFSFGSGYVYLRDPDHEPFLVDSLRGGLRFDPAAQRFLLDGVEWRAGASRIAASGTVTPPASAGEAWRIEMASSPGSVFGPERAGDFMMPVERGRISARFSPEAGVLTIDRLEAFGPHIDLTATLEAIFRDPSDLRLRIALAIGRMPTTAVLRLWPSTVAPPVRGYLMDNLQGGTVAGKLSLDFDATAFAELRRHDPPPDPSLRFDFAVSNGALQLLPGVPPLAGVEAIGVVTGRATSLSFSKGAMEGRNGRKLTLVDGTFSAPENEKTPAPATVVARLTGPMDAVADILGRDGMKPYGGMQIDSSVMKGQVDAQLNINLKLSKKVNPGDTVVRVNANIANLTIDKLVGKERLEQGSLTVASDPTGLKASGQGRLFGAPATIEMKKPPGGDMDATIGFTLDEAGRNRMGMAFGAGVTGPIGAKVTSAFGVKDPPPAQVELDLQRTGLDGVLPGLVKPAGRPAKATFLFDSNVRGATIDQFVFDAAGGASARGVIELDGAGGFRSARFSQLRLSSGDDMKVDAEEGKDGVKITVRASTVDAKPFLKSVFGDNAGKDISASKDIELDLRAGTVVGGNRQNLSGMELKISRHGGAVRNFQMQARTVRAPVIGVTTRSAAGDPVISISTADGGAFLGFLDFYKRMEGGRFELAARMDPSGIDGSFRVSDFILRDEPALRRLVTEGVAARDEKGAIRIDTTAAVFTRMQASFTRSGGEVAVRDGLLVGNQIGIKLDGSLDFDRDRLNVAGTFVPFYGVNNLFSQIPVFGPILGGGSNEGLFAVNFRATGAISAPQLTINPLSAIAPGFLRNLFGPGGLGGPIPTLPQPTPQQAPR